MIFHHIFLDLVSDIGMGPKRGFKKIDLQNMKFGMGVP